jgi:hypothetical protein
MLEGQTHRGRSHREEEGCSSSLHEIGGGSEKVRIWKDAWI